MCDPAALTNAQIGGTALSSIGAYFAASQERDSLAATAATANANARIAESAAQNAIRRGDKELAQIGRYGAQVRGAQKVAVATSGLDLNSVGSQAAFASTDAAIRDDLATAKSNAMFEAWGYSVQAANSRTEASVAKAKRGTFLTPALASLPPLLAGATQVAEKNYRYRKATEGY